MILIRSRIHLDISRLKEAFTADTERSDGNSPKLLGSAAKRSKNLLHFVHRPAQSPWDVTKIE